MRWQPVDIYGFSRRLELAEELGWPSERPPAAFEEAVRRALIRGASPDEVIRRAIEAGHRMREVVAYLVFMGELGPPEEPAEAEAPEPSRAEIPKLKEKPEVKPEAKGELGSADCVNYSRGRCTRIQPRF